MKSFKRRHKANPLEAKNKPLPQQQSSTSSPSKTNFKFEDKKHFRNVSKFYGSTNPIHQRSIKFLETMPNNYRFEFNGIGFYGTGLPCEINDDVVNITYGSVKYNMEAPECLSVKLEKMPSNQGFIFQNLFFFGSLPPKEPKNKVTLTETGSDWKTKKVFVKRKMITWDKNTGKKSIQYNNNNGRKKDEVIEKMEKFASTMPSNYTFTHNKGKFLGSGLFSSPKASPVTITYGKVKYLNVPKEVTSRLNTMRSNHGIIFKDIFLFGKVPPPLHDNTIVVENGKFKHQWNLDTLVYTYSRGTFDRRRRKIGNYKVLENYQHKPINGGHGGDDVPDDVPDDEEFPELGS